MIGLQQGGADVVIGYGVIIAAVALVIMSGLRR